MGDLLTPLFNLWNRSLLVSFQFLLFFRLFFFASEVLSLAILANLKQDLGKLPHDNSSRSEKRHDL
jgi:hypothetical protein